MKDRIPYPTINQVAEQVKRGPDESVSQISEKIDLLPNYITAALQGVQDPKFTCLVQQTEDQIRQNQQANPSNGISRTAGVYLANENVIAGSMVPQGVALANQYGQKYVPDWESRAYKLKLGPGITFVQPAAVYSLLMKQGAENPELAVNYTAPFGTLKARLGLADVMNARLNNQEVYDPEEVIQTDGCTEGIELALEAVGKLYPGSEILSLGFSYYTALFAAEQKGLKIARVMPSIVESSDSTKMRPSIEEIRQALTTQSKVLLLTDPNNPTGEKYSSQELQQLMELAKEKNLLILFDAIFEEMEFDGDDYSSPVLMAAAQAGVLDQILVVDSLSKRRGLAGGRPGWLATKNRKVLSVLEDVILARRCNPTLLFEPIAQFEGAASQWRNISTNLPVVQQRKVVEELIKTKSLPWSADSFLAMYDEWFFWQETTQEYYRQNLEIMRLTLDGFAQGFSQDSAAFNAFVQLGENISSTDFMTKLMLLFGTYTQVGPCFGISESVWKQQLGLWARVSYAMERQDLIEGLTRMLALAIAFNEYQLGNDSQYPVMSINYDQQI